MLAGISTSFTSTIATLIPHGDVASSMISLAYGMGMLLAMTRERPRAEYLVKQNFGYAGSLA